MGHDSGFRMLKRFISDRKIEALVAGRDKYLGRLPSRRFRFRDNSSLSLSNAGRLVERVPLPAFRLADSLMSIS